MKAILRLAVLIALITPAFGATVGELEPAGGTWRVYRGTGFSTYVCRANSEAAALSCASADAEARKAPARYQIRYPNRYVTVTYTLPDSTPVDCVVSPWGAWDGGAWSACANGTQTRQETRSRTILTQPANGGVACPALTETRTATQTCGVEPPPTGALFSDDFRTGAKAAPSNGVGWSGRGESISIVPYASSPSGYAMRFRYAGVPSGQDSWAEQRFTLSDLTEVWLEVVLDVPANYVHRNDSGADNNKLVRVWKGDKTDNNNGYSRYAIKGGLSLLPSSDGSSVIVEWGRKGEGVGRNSTGSAPLITAADKGKRIKLVFHARTDKKGTVGASMASTGGDGAIELWKDAKKVIGYTTLSWRSIDGKNEAFDMGYLLGWANSGFAKETDIHVVSVSFAAGNVYGVQ